MLDTIVNPFRYGGVVGEETFCNRTRELRELRRAGLRSVDLSDNEMAKLHVRHLVGGHAPRPRGTGRRAVGPANEVLYRFEFPERPGALLRFLNQMGERWNISLFHYRNHGAADGRVLAGIQVPNGDASAFREMLDQLGYPYHDETHNPAYEFYLAGR